MTIAPNFTIVTLGVADVEKSAGFYRTLGWEQCGDTSAGITWFRTSGTWLGLFADHALAADVGVEPESLPTFRGITLALNLNDEETVDLAIAEAVHAATGRTTALRAVG